MKFSLPSGIAARISVVGNNKLARSSDGFEIVSEFAVHNV
jgi:hypothetical protein